MPKKHWLQQVTEFLLLQMPSDLPVKTYLNVLKPLKTVYFIEINKKRHRSRWFIFWKRWNFSLCQDNSHLTLSQWLTAHAHPKWSHRLISFQIQPLILQPSKHSVIHSSCPNESSESLFLQSVPVRLGILLFCKPGCLWIKFPCESLSSKLRRWRTASVSRSYIGSDYKEQRDMSGQERCTVFWTASTSHNVNYKVHGH